MVSKEKILSLIKSLDKELKLYEDPVYSADRRAIKAFEQLTFELYSDLKKDGHLKLEITKQESEGGLRMAKFSKIAVNIPNKLLKIETLKAEEQWYIILSIYCWWCESIKNILSDFALKIYRSLTGKRWKKSFMTMGPFIDCMNKYKNGKYTSLFSDINIDLRNSFIHGKIDFPDNEVVYYDSRGNEKRIGLEDLLSQFKRLPPLCAYLFASRLKPFRRELVQLAKDRGFL